MKITQIRNATMVIEVAGQSILVDPMFAPKGAIPSLKYFTGSRQRNPLVDLPEQTDVILERVTACLITHCQKGHFDHLDRKAVKWLREKNVTVYCSSQDASYLRKKGLKVIALDPDNDNAFLNGCIRLVPCRHGTGLVGRFMAHGYGYQLALPGEPDLYIAGDTILTDEVRSHLAESKPKVCVIPAGGARMDIGSHIIMGLDEALELGDLVDGVVVANHLEALDHCPVTRQELIQEVNSRNWEQRYFVPNDGESLTISTI